jgi:hypothetical protein
MIHLLIWFRGFFKCRNEEDAKRCVEARMNTHLPKILQMKLMVEAIRECCKK